MSKSSNSWQRQRYSWYSWYTQMFSLENSDGWEGFAGSLAESHQAHKASWCMPCRSTLTMEEELEMCRFEIKAYRDRSKQINHACFCQSKMLLFHIVILCTIYVFLIMFNPSRQQCKQSRIFENDCCKQIFGLWEPVQPGSSRFNRALEIWSLSLQVHPGSSCSSQARCCSHAFRSSFSAQGCLSMPVGEIFSTWNMVLRDAERVECL